MVQDLFLIPSLHLSTHSQSYLLTPVSLSAAHSLLFVLPPLFYLVSLHVTSHASAQLHLIN